LQLGQVAVEGLSAEKELVHTRQQCLKKQGLQMVTVLMALMHLQGGPYLVVVAEQGGRLAPGGIGWVQYQQVPCSRRARAIPGGSSG
jgi:hypothetical protein